jgi:hypothetical protein
MSQSVPNVNPRWDDPSAHKGKYPPDWDARRGVVYERDNWTCQSCGHMSGPHAGSEGRALHPHHIVPLSKGGWHNFTNLETLCDLCHNGQHEHNIFASDSSGPSLRGFFADMLRACAVCGLLLLVIAAYGSIVIGAGISVVSSTTLPLGMIGIGAIGTLLGVLVAMLWPRIVGVVFALVGIVLTGLASSFPGAQLSDPAVALILAMFGVPVLVAGGKHFTSTTSGV